MLDSIQDKVRRSARRAVLAVLTGVCAAIGAGFASFAGFAGLREAGLSPAMAGFVLACVWFGLAGVCLIVRGLSVGDGMSANRFGARDMPRERQAPPLAEAFSAGLAEGSAFATRRKAR